MSRNTSRRKRDDPFIAGHVSLQCMSTATKQDGFRVIVELVAKMHYRGCYVALQKDLVPGGLFPVVRGHGSLRERYGSTLLGRAHPGACVCLATGVRQSRHRGRPGRSEEHTSELQSRRDLVCRLLLEKKKKKTK